MLKLVEKLLERIHRIVGFGFLAVLALFCALFAALILVAVCSGIGELLVPHRVATELAGLLAAAVGSACGLLELARYRRARLDRDDELARGRSLSPGLVQLQGEVVSESADTSWLRIGAENVRLARQVPPGPRWLRGTLTGSPGAEGPFRTSASPYKLTVAASSHLPFASPVPSRWTLGSGIGLVLVVTLAELLLFMPVRTLRARGVETVPTSSHERARCSNDAGGPFYYQRNEGVLGEAAVNAPVEELCLQPVTVIYDPRDPDNAQVGRREDLAPPPLPLGLVVLCELGLLIALGLSLRVPGRSLDL